MLPKFLTSHTVMSNLQTLANFHASVATVSGFGGGIAFNLDGEWTFVSDSHWSAGSPGSSPSLGSC